MKKLLFALSLAGTALWSPLAAADQGGSCHFHGSKAAPEATVTGCAMQRKAALVKAGKLDASWGAVKHEKIEVVDGKKGKEWKLTFANPAATDRSKATLYMFYTPPGNFIAANFTGQ